MYEIHTEDILKIQNNDEDTLSKIITNNSGLVWNIVKRFLGRGYEAEELYQVGCIGFIKAIKRFDPNYDVKLSTYSVPYILGEIKRFIRDDGPIKISRSIKELSIKIKEIQKQYLNANGEEITLSVIAKKLNISKEEVALALEIQNPIESIDEYLYEDVNKGESKISQITDEKDEAEILTNKLCVNELIKNLNDKEKQIIFLRYYKGKTQLEIAKTLGISQVQVSRIEKKSLLLMRNKMEA